MAESVSDISFVDKPYGLKGSKRRRSVTARLLLRKMAMAMAFTGAKNSICSSLILTPSASLDQVQTTNLNYLFSLFDDPSNSLSFCLFFSSSMDYFCLSFSSFCVLAFLPPSRRSNCKLSTTFALFFSPLFLKDFMVSHNSSFCGCRNFVLREFCAFFGTCILLSVKDFSAIVHAPALFFRLISGLSFG
jgi:hypothetical protein